MQAMCMIPPGEGRATTTCHSTNSLVMRAPLRATKRLVAGYRLSVSLLLFVTPHMHEAVEALRCCVVVVMTGIVVVIYQTLQLLSWRILPIIIRRIVLASLAVPRSFDHRSVLSLVRQTGCLRRLRLQHYRYKVKIYLL